MRAALALLLVPLTVAAEEVVVRAAVGAEPMPDATVSVVGPDDGVVFDPPNWAPDARTDASGQAVVEAGPGQWILVYAPGYALEVVPAGGRFVDVALRPERIYSGRVVDTKGVPVSGARVELATTFRKSARFLATSGAGGWFHVYGLWLDDYALRIEAARFLSWAPGASRAVEQSGETFVLARASAIAGRVADRESKPLAGVEVVAIGVVITIRLGEPIRTAADGSYRIDGLASGVGFVELGYPWSGRAGPIQLAEGEVHRGADIVASPPATVRVRVVNESREGLSGVTARLRTEAISDATGRIVLPVQAHRSHTLRLHAPHFEAQSVPVPPLAPDARHDLGEVVLRPLPAIEVRVRRPDGTAPPQGAVGGLALADGVARIEGAQRCAVVVPGYPPLHVDVEPPGPVEVALPVPQWIEGLVLDPFGAPETRAEVHGGGFMVRTNDEGRFRLGPFATGPVAVEARTATAASRVVPVVLGDGELELTVVGTEADLLRGRVLRGNRPVPRFRVEGERFVDEEGKFELLLHRAGKAWVTVGIGERSFRFPLPPEGRPLVARLPAGEVEVLPEGAAPGRTVWVANLSGDEIEARTAADGLARFRDLAAGVYAAGAAGFARTEFRVEEGIDQLVTLHAEPQGVLRVRAPRGFETLPTFAAVQALPPGVHTWGLFAAEGPYTVLVTAARIHAGEETLVDFDPPDAGSLALRAAAGAEVELELVRDDARLAFRTKVPGDGVFRFANLPPGVYVLRSTLASRTFDITPGAATELALAPGFGGVTGAVLLQEGKPAQGASVRLVPDDGGREREAITDLRGRFRFAGVPPGGYDCVATLPGRRPAAGRVVVAADGIRTEGLPLHLAPGVAAHARLLGLAGEPVASVPVRVDGQWIETDALGRLPLDRVPATLDLDLEGYASLRDLEVTAGDEVRLRRGGTLVVLTDGGAAQVVVRIDGRVWARLRPRLLPDGGPAGRLVLEDLPPGPVEVEGPRREAAAEGDEAEAREAEPIRATLRPGAATVIDLKTG
ncbi:MAG: carboxypeptidase regulatory-like domain-containing protein [Planctomycetota bacterium]|jgi:hypothetical protein